MAESSLMKKKIVVIGYGPAGSQLTANLAKVATKKNYSITVVTPFDYQEVSLCMTKVVAVGTEEHEKALFSLVQEDGVEYITEACASLSDGVLTTASGRQIAYDICIVATGTKLPKFMPDVKDSSMDLRKATISAFSSEISRANSIVFSGGGPVATECAADIKLRFKEKSVHIVFPGPSVLSRMNEPFQKVANDALQKIGIEMHPNNRVISAEGGEAKLKSGESIPCDLYIPAHAVGANTGFMPEGTTNERGFIIVDDSLKVQGLTSAFALGDCSAFDDVKVYVKIADQMPTMLTNIDAFLAQKPLKHHKKGASFEGKMVGPVMVAFGHDHPEGFGVGPDLPGCMGSCCWVCCCCGPPCSTPAGKGVAKAKADFNRTVFPKKGKGMNR